MDLAASAASIRKPEKLTLTITENEPPRISVIPFKRSLIASVSEYHQEPVSDSVFINTTGFSGGYLVEEAFPVSYEKMWDNGTPTPGVCLLTLFRKKNDIDRDTFINRWQNGHTPLTLKIHPVWHYNRNEVTKRITPDSEEHDGIVEEHFHSNSDLLNPTIFFGNPFTMVPNMIRVYRDVRSFLDYKTTEPYLTREYHLF